MMHRKPTTIEAPNRRIPVFVVIRENQNTSAAIAPIPFMTTIVARFKVLTLTGVSAESEATNGTGVWSVEPHFSQKMRPVVAAAPH